MTFDLDKLKTFWQIRDIIVPPIGIEHFHRRVILDNGEVNLVIHYHESDNKYLLVFVTKKTKDSKLGTDYEVLYNEEAMEAINAI